MPVFLPVLKRGWQTAEIYCTCEPKFCQFWSDLPVLKRGWQTIWQPLFVAIPTFYPLFCQFASFVLIARS
nr:MAG TPA: hypothetical protein [Caudoviricetes sp.]